MVLREIGKACGLQHHTVQPPLVQPVRRGLHRGVGDPARSSRRQCAVQGDRLGRGVGQRGGPCALDACGAKVDRGQAHFDPDLPHKGRDRCFAIGAGDCDHHLRLRAKEQRGGAGQCLARGVGNHECRVRGRKRVTGQFGPRPVRQNGRSTALQRALDKAGSVHTAARHGGKQRALARFAAVNAQVDQRRIRPRHGHQPQRIQRDTAGRDHRVAFSA